MGMRADGPGEGADRRRRLEPVHDRHHHVHQHQVVGAGRDRADGGLPVGDGGRAVAEALEQAGRDQAVGRVVLGDQHARRRGRRLGGGGLVGAGRAAVMVRRAAGAQHDVEAERRCPRPGALSTHDRPAHLLDEARG